MRQIVIAVGMGFAVIMLQACATPSRPTGHQTVAFSEGQQTPPSQEEYLQKVERHLERQARPGTTLPFRRSRRTANRRKKEQGRRSWAR